HVERRQLSAGVGPERSARVVERQRQAAIDDEEQEAGDHRSPYPLRRAPTLLRDRWRRSACVLADVYRVPRCLDRGARHSMRRARISISRGMVDAAPYSHAEAMNPGGGAGSSMSSISRPTSPITCTY